MEFDKQVKFMGVKEIITRTDVKTKIKQHPWTSFGAIEWDGKTYKKDQLVSFFFVFFFVDSHLTLFTFYLFNVV